MYAKLNNGILEYAPTNYELEDGRIITNFNKSEGLMKEHGFKEIIDIKPTYEKDTQYLSIKDYTENDTNIIINYEIKENLVIPSVEQRLESVEEVILNLL